MLLDFKWQRDRDLARPKSIRKITKKQRKFLTQLTFVKGMEIIYFVSITSQN